MKTKVVDLVELIILVVLRRSNSLFSLRYSHIEFCPFPKGFLKENPAGGRLEGGLGGGLGVKKS